jgi:AhpD family alkylhydroperoxidase
VLLAVSVENRCNYCVAGHTVFARGLGVPEHVIESVRNDAEIANTALETLRVFARELVRQRGAIQRQDLQAFFAAGFDQEQLQDVVLGAVLKTFSNYVAIMLDLPLDRQFQAGAWTATDKAA